MFTVYILQSEANGRFYTGCTEDLPKRFEQHQAGLTSSTKAYRPWNLVHAETFPTRSLALARERQIKNWRSRTAISRLLQKANT